MLEMISLMTLLTRKEQTRPNQIRSVWVCARVSAGAGAEVQFSPLSVLIRKIEQTRDWTDKNKHKHKHNAQA